VNAKLPKGGKGYGDRGGSMTQRLTLFLILGLAFFLRSLNIDKEGFGNDYYFAAVHSMLKSFHNFFFCAYDPVDIVTVDKPPVSLWIQAASAWLFGFNTAAIMLPQAVLGTINVFLTWQLMKKAFSSREALIAALVMAILPIAIALDRLNMPDTVLLTTVLLSALFLLRACQKNSFLDLLISMIFLGIGFNTKMFAAWVVLPAWFFTWWNSTFLHKTEKIKKGSVAIVVLVLTSLSWSLLIDLIPAEHRPYVGGSTRNSMLELSLGYNGLGRIFGGMGNLPSTPASYADEVNKPGGKFFFAGPIGPWRMLWPTMAGLAFWLTPFALQVCLSRRTKKRKTFNSAEATLDLLVGWFLMWGIVLCFSKGMLHPYYSHMIGPAMAGLAAISFEALLEKGWPNHWKGIAFFVFAVAWQLITISYSPEWRGYLGPAVGLVLVTSYYWGTFKRRGVRNSLALRISVFGFLTAPFLWALTPTFGQFPTMMPTADPSFLYAKPRPIRRPGLDNLSEGQRNLVAYLKKQDLNSKILLAAHSSWEVNSYLINTDENIVSLGGFMGKDPIFSEAQLLEMVEKGDLVYFISNSGKGIANQTLREFIEKHGELVDANEWLLTKVGYSEIAYKASLEKRKRLAPHPELFRLKRKVSVSQ